ncbi:SDR family NAD(P)-dependent oxidoreductase [Hylemonella sp. W303a]|uniref:SDR family NAD(P)-dependent oxidoreductase n=1 Tax=Hylemonella sp. W303a TaxID=3389873 RepID=UPI00396B1CA2
MKQTSTPIALITGGSRGLGRNAAFALAAQGSDLIITYQRQQADALAVVAQVQVQHEGRRAVALQLDTGDSASFPAFATRLRELLATQWQRTHFDHLINNAGFGHHAAFAETTEADFDALYRVHLKGPYFLTQALLPLIADGGRILNISSGLARFSFPGSSAYAMMKGGVEVMTRYMAKELGSRGIAVNTLSPGAIETDFSGGRVRDDATLNRALAAQTALGRVGLPDDIGGAIAALLAPGSHWINAQRVEASGGMLI